MIRALAVSFASLLLPLLLLRLTLADGISQLVMQNVFILPTSSCAGHTCREQFIGGAEAFGLPARGTCSSAVRYGEDSREHEQELFELVYTCRTADGLEVDTAEECGIEVCLDAGTNPATSEITYQVAFEARPGLRETIVSAKLYFYYFDVRQPYYDVWSAMAEPCPLQEVCHARCAEEESLFDIELADEIGDGWNAGSLGMYDWFWVHALDESYHNGYNGMSSSGEVAGDEASADAATSLMMESEAYRVNTLLGGYSRRVPLCLADGDYLFLTQFTASRHDGGQAFESWWDFCGVTGILSETMSFSVMDGVCVPTFHENRTIVVTPTSSRSVTSMEDESSSVLFGRAVSDSDGWYSDTDHSWSHRSHGSGSTSSGMASNRVGGSDDNKEEGGDGDDMEAGNNGNTAEGDDDDTEAGDHGNTVEGDDNDTEAGNDGDTMEGDGDDTEAGTHGNMAESGDDDTEAGNHGNEEEGNDDKSDLLAGVKGEEAVVEAWMFAAGIGSLFAVVAVAILGRYAQSRGFFSGPQRPAPLSDLARLNGIAAGAPDPDFDEFTP